jgi:hypothetical protein
MTTDLGLCVLELCWPLVTGHFGPREQDRGQRRTACCPNRVSEAEFYSRLIQMHYIMH